MHNNRYKRFKFVNFKTNLKNLIAVTNKERARMQHDTEAFGHDLQIVKALRANEDLPQSWHLSEARKFLKLDMAAGKHLEPGFNPRTLWATRTAYKQYSPEVFRKAINNAKNKKERFEFRMAKKKFRTPPMATPVPLPTIPLAFGGAKQKKKKGTKKN